MTLREQVRAYMLHHHLMGVGDATHLDLVRACLIYGSGR